LKRRDIYRDKNKQTIRASKCADNDFDKRRATREKKIVRIFFLVHDRVSLFIAFMKSDADNLANDN